MPSLVPRLSSISLAGRGRRVDARSTNSYNLVGQAEDEDICLAAGRVSSRRVLSGLVLLALIAVAGVEAVGLVISHLSNNFVKRSAKIGGATELIIVPDVGPYKNEPSCPQNGKICICTDGYDVNGEFANGVYTCKQWTFQVGDVLFCRKPSDATMLHNAPSAVIAMVSHSDYIHAGIVVNVPPAGENQTGDNIFVMEALKGDYKVVKNNSLRNAIQRWPFGGYMIKRPDPAKFPTFTSAGTVSAIQTFAEQQIGKSFDEAMLNPLKKRFGTNGRFVSVAPGCKERKRALSAFESGGNSMWICAQLVAWTLAFAGGIDKTYGRPVPNCDVAEFMWMDDLQPSPGELTRMDIWDPITHFHVMCPVDKCWVAVPDTPDWAGGTTAAPTTTTTTTTTTLATSTTLASSTSTLASSTSTLASSTSTTTIKGHAAATNSTVAPKTNSTVAPKNSTVARPAATELRE